MKEEDIILGALARGYGSERNQHKTLDADLIQDMAKQIEPLIRELEKTIRSSYESPLREIAGYMMEKITINPDEVTRENMAELCMCIQDICGIAKRALD